jgi:Tol biopolymer transport system component
MISRVLLVASFATAAAAEEITDIHLAASPAVSPDGNSMVFEWIGDLWCASTDGGEAVRVLENPAFETRPLFSPDGKRIIFSSDRTGSMQVFSIPTSGGEPVQHTRHSEGNLLECLSPDGTHAIVRGDRERSGRLLVVSLVNDEREQLLFDAEAHSASWSPDGTRLLFCTGGNPYLRKGYKGSRASQIWEYDMSSGNFECRVAEETESTSPRWHADGNGFHYVSARTGVPQVLSKRDNPAVPSAEGATLVLQQGIELSRVRPGIDATPVPLKLWTRAKMRDISRDRKPISTTTDVDFSPQLDELVFAAAGELWWIQKRGDSPVMLTTTAAAEEDVHFSKDGEWLYFLRDNGLEANYFRARFIKGILSEEQPISRGNRSKSHFSQSADGGRVGWIEGTGELFTAESNGTETRCVFKCWDTPTYDWSPSGDWLAVAAEDKNSNRDIWLVAVDGRRKPLNLTRHPAYEGFPRWSPDGRRLLFSACRDADGTTDLWQINFGKEEIFANTPDANLLHHAGKTTVVSTGDIDPIRAIWTADSSAILFQNNKDPDPNLYSVSLAAQEVKVVAEERGIPIRVASDGSLLWRVKKSPAILKGSELTRFPISASVDRPRGEVLKLAFRRIWRTVGERYYDAGMNGTDWETLRCHYEPAAAGARSSKQFEGVVRQLLSELNASHLTFSAERWPNETIERHLNEPTAHPGLIFRIAPFAGRDVVRSSQARGNHCENRGRNGYQPLSPPPIFQWCGGAGVAGGASIRGWEGAGDRAAMHFLRGRTVARPESSGAPRGSADFLSASSGHEHENF